MRIEKVVVNSSPLIVLFRSGQAELLHRMFSNVARNRKERCQACGRHLGQTEFPRRRPMSFPLGLIPKGKKTLSSF